jgi:hypothetical protein
MRNISFGGRIFLRPLINRKCKTNNKQIIAPFLAKKRTMLKSITSEKKRDDGPNLRKKTEIIAIENVNEI